MNSVMHPDQREKGGDRVAFRILRAHQDMGRPMRSTPYR